MAANDYHFITHWSVAATIQEVIDILSDATSLPQWWSSVYRDVQQVAPGDARGIGTTISLDTKGWLPYTLHWQARVTEIDGAGFTIAATGDFDGLGTWNFVQRGSFVDITYDWRIRADKPLLRRLSWLLKPIFAANHRWAMAQGERSLKLELTRRAATAEEQARIPPPPQAIGSRPILLGTLVIMLGLVYWLAQRIRDHEGSMHWINKQRRPSSNN